MGTCTIFGTKILLKRLIKPHYMMVFLLYVYPSQYDGIPNIHVAGGVEGILAGHLR